MREVKGLLFSIITLLLAFFIGFITGKKSIEIITDEVIKVDTVYDKVVFDSIEYNIQKHDSVIVEIKKQIVYETDEAVNADDSIVVEQFKSLAGAN